MKFCFVILHYKTIDDTIKCVESIKQHVKNCHIVIVDNASDNGSIERVQKLYGKDERITILCNEKNLGFASGNNVGYRYARKKIKADFIAVSNNDIVIETDDFCEKFYELYKQTGFHVAGPDIVSMIDGGHQNPMCNNVPDMKTAEKEIWRYRILYMLSRLHIYDFLKKKKKSSPVYNVPKQNLRDIQENVMLHGSFVVFSPLFIEHEKYSFRPGTFLYMEEAILRQYCVKKGYKMVFTPQARVYHKEDSSTNALFKATKDKREFVFKHMIRSLIVYRKVLKEKI